MLEGLRGEERIARTVSRDGVARVDRTRLVERVLDVWQETRRIGDTASRTSVLRHEVKDLRREAQALKEVVADLTRESRLLKSSMMRVMGESRR